MSTAASEAEAAVETVHEVSRRFRAGDFEGAFRLYHPDIGVEQPASLPHGGRHEGLPGLAAMAAEFGRHWERTIGEPRILGLGASVLQVTTQTWTAKETARSATVDVVELITVADGLVTEIRVFPQDTHLLLATLDAPTA
ncbi:nuclear transport factor 2 family protein [Yinghuangia sp. ASG 101]|uniref:nuclear transport factor 2 family protein n=1 Tax=Yinghuangia sp. ASG 101 TaxID=2896848 RepID=UPI001E32BC13|nr:nuclear transport factor 2 family protein [Yinghuangia sp. ASG 101]UGQ12455.1 nuclear transport factor 2 family protein [Yinghuangia sp. ASG 101]